MYIYQDSLTTFGKNARTRPNYGDEYKTSGPTVPFAGDSSRTLRPEPHDNTKPKPSYNHESKAPGPTMSAPRYSSTLCPELHTDTTPIPSYAYESKIIGAHNVGCARLIYVTPRTAPERKHPNLVTRTRPSAIEPNISAARDSSTLHTIPHVREPSW